MLVVGNVDTGKTELIKKIVQKDKFENKITNIVFDTRGEYSDLSSVNGVNYKVIKDIANLEYDFNKKLNVFNMKNIPCDLLDKALEVLINKASMMPKNVRVIIDQTSDFLVNSNLDTLLVGNMDKKKNLSFIIVSTDLYGMYKSLELFDTHIFFWINVFARQKLIAYSDYDTMSVAIRLKPYNIILNNKKENQKIIVNIRDKSINFNSVANA